MYIFEKYADITSKIHDIISYLSSELFRKISVKSEYYANFAIS